MAPSASLKSCKLPHVGRDRSSKESFVRHRGPVTCVVEAPSRNLAITAAYDGAIGLFDLTSRTVELLGYHDHLVNKVVVNEAETRAASSSSDYTVRIWNLKTRALELVLLGHSDDVEDFVFVDDGRGVSVSRDRRVLVWDLNTGAIRRVIEGHEKDALSVAYADGRIYTSGDDMTLRVWDLETGALLRKWGPFENETDTCAIDIARGRAVLGCDDGIIRIFDIATGASVSEISAHLAGIKKVATSPANGDIISAAYDRKIRIWDAVTHLPKLELEYRPSVWERSMSWSTDGRRILGGTFDGTVLVWNAQTGPCIDEVGDRGHGNPCFNDVVANARGDFVTVSDDGVLRIGKLTSTEANWSHAIEPDGERILANAVTMDDTRKIVVSGCHDQMLRVTRLDANGPKSSQEIPLNEGPINSVRIARHPNYDGDIFAACYSGAIVRINAMGSRVATIRLHEGAVKGLRLHPTEALGVSCSADGGLLSWDFSGQLLKRFPGHIAIVDDVDIDPSGTWIASVSRDFTMKVYELGSGRLTHSVTLGSRSPKSVCFLDASTVIVSNYWGRLIRVELDSGRTRSNQIANNGISAVSRGCGGLIAVSYDGGAYLVDPNSLTLINSLRSMTQRLRPSALFQ
jgi:WD40 repeat protein